MGGVAQDRYYKQLWLLTYLVCISFTCLVVVLYFNNRINNSDEFLFLSNMKKLGFWKSLGSWNYNQRPVSYFLFNLTFYLNSTISSLRWFLLIGNLTFLFFFILSFKLIVGRFLIYNSIRLQKKQVWAIAILLAILTFFFCFERSETWFWYICTIIYLLPIAFLNYGISFLLESSRIKWFSLVFFFLIGGSLELMIPIAGTILLIFFFYRKITILTFISNSFALFFFSFFQFFNNGIENRLEMESKNDILYQSNFTSTFGHLFDAKNIFFVLIAFILLALFHQYKFKREVVIKQLKVVTITFTVSFLVTRMISSIVFSGSYGVLRMWMPSSFFLMLLILLIMVYLSIKRAVFRVELGIISAITYLVLFSFFAYKQITLTTTYANEYDAVLSNKTTKIKYIDSGVLVSPGNMQPLIENRILYNDK